MTEQRKNTNSWPHARDRIMDTLGVKAVDERGKPAKPTLQEVITWIEEIREQRDWLMEDGNQAVGRLADVLDVSDPTTLEDLLSLVSNIDESLTKAEEADRAHLAGLVRALNGDTEPKHNITWERMIALVDIQTREIKALQQREHDIRVAHQTTQETALTLHATLRKVGSALGLPGGDFTPDMVVTQARKIIENRHELLMREREREEHTCEASTPTLSALIRLHEENYLRMGAALGVQEEQPTVHDILMAATQLEAQAKAFREADGARLALVRRVQELEADLAAVRDDQEAAERAEHDYAPVTVGEDSFELQAAENLVRAVKAAEIARQLRAELAEANERIERLHHFDEMIEGRRRDILAEYDVLTLALAYKWGDAKKNQFIEDITHGNLLTKLEDKYRRRKGMDKI